MWRAFRRKLAPVRLKIEQIAEYYWWKRHGRPVPPPHMLKQRVLLHYARRSRATAFIETGTYLGEMVAAMRKRFSGIYSVELDKTLYKKACARFAQDPHIHILQGNSADLLPQILQEISEPALFWLDGHYSGGNTAKGNLSTPIRQELEAILRHGIKEHVILIDDARLFTGVDDYPTLSELKEFISKERPDLHVHVQDDMIRIHRADS